MSTFPVLPVSGQSIPYDPETGEILPRGFRSDDEWAAYIAEANPSALILERGLRQYQYWEHCQREYRKQGGSHYSQFCLERFGQKQSASSFWKAIGENHGELINIINKFAPDYLAMYLYTTLDPPDKDYLLALPELISQKSIKELKKKEREKLIEKQREDIAAGRVVTPEGLFDVVVIDPPWNYGREYDPETSRVANPYPEMTQDELLALEPPCAPDSVLFLWTTHQFIWDAHELMNAWGFEYKAMLVWDKEKLGMGAWLRMQCEFCLVGIRGTPFWENTTWRDLIREPRREHSRKPDGFYALVESVTAGRRLDYFSREPRPGWEQVGNSPELFAEGRHVERV